MNPTLDVLLSHTSIRKFKETPIDDKTINLIVEAAQWSATSSHYQAFTIIRVMDEKKRNEIMKVTGGQKWVVEAPVFLVFCADLHRGQQIWKNIDPSVLSNTEQFIMSTVDASLAAQKAIIAAQSLGLGGVFIGGIRNDLKTMCNLLELPQLVYPVFGMCLGYPDEFPQKKPRLPQEVIYKVDTYQGSDLAEQIASYDETVKQYYWNRSDGKINDLWSERCGRTMMDKTRDDVGPAVKAQGFVRR